MVKNRSLSLSTGGLSVVDHRIVSFSFADLLKPAEIDEKTQISLSDSLYCGLSKQVFL